ncbi:MAG: c-type cytochrome [Planctomycetota bacterium]
MSSRPSARYNDPGYFYSPKKLIRIFTILSVIMLLGIFAMIYVDWARPWKVDQIAEMKWEARRLELEAMILSARTAEARKEISDDETAAQKEFDAREDELKALQKDLAKARGAFYGADMAYKTQKQFTGEAIYESEHAHGDGVAAAMKRLNAERDKEARLKAAVASAQNSLDVLVAKEKHLRRELDAVVQKIRANPSIKKLMLVEAARDKKRSVNPLREAPLLDFLAPPTKVEQVVLENIVDNYEFATPAKVDRCGTCHIGVMRLGFEATKWPVEALDMEPGAEKSELIEQGVYEFIFTLLDSVWKKVDAKDPFPYEQNLRRTLAIHHETLNLLFIDYDDEDGTIYTYPDKTDDGKAHAKAGRKAWKKWYFSEKKGRWIPSSKKGSTLAEYYYGLLQRVAKHWRSHPFLKDMVGSQSPHPYERVGCTVCHQGRGWSTDFGFAFHVPDLKPVDNWMTVARAEEMHAHLPESTDLTLDEAMFIGALNAYELAAWEAVPPLEEKLAAASAKVKSLNGDKKSGSDNPALVQAQSDESAAKAELAAAKADDHYKKAAERLADLRNGWITDEAKGHAWHDDLGWTHEKLHHWDWPQLPKTLVQSACLKCHKEGLYKSAPPEYENVHIGKPPTGLPDTKAVRTHFKQFNKIEGEDYSARMFVPEKEPPYEPDSLQRGMDNFLRFGCYGCHKLDEKVYPFMATERKRMGPQLNDIAVKTDRIWSKKWVRNPKDFRPGTRMPRFFGLSNSSRDFPHRFAAGDGSEETLHAGPWSDAEVHAIVEWLFAQSEENGTFKAPPVDISKGDAARGERILVGGDDGTNTDAKGCIACHDITLTTKELQYKQAQLKAGWEGAPTGTTVGWGERMSRRQGPTLDGLGSKLKPEWLVAWLKNPRGYWHDTNMPDLRLTDQEALDVAAYLISLKHSDFDALPAVNVDADVLNKLAQELKVGEQREPVSAALGIVANMSEREKTLYVGGRLFKHYGCFGCHSVKAYENTSPIGTELTTWGSKLIARLAFNHVPMEKTRFDFAYTKLMNPRVYDLGTALANTPFDRLKMPRFNLTSQEARDIATFLVALVDDKITDKARFIPDTRQTDILRGRQVVRRYNCQGCHVIEGKGGDIWPSIKEAKWRPPDLIGQGLKTNPQWLFHFMKDPDFVSIEGQKGSDRVRPWHSIRMPTFHLDDDETRALVRYFAALSDASPDFEGKPKDSLVGKDAQYKKPLVRTIKDPDDAEGKRELRIIVRNRLEETQALFKALACKSCHSLDADVKTQAPNFRHTRGGRLHSEWLKTWLWNPSKLQPGTAMPTFFADDKGPKTDFEQFFGGSPDEQIRALRDYIRWHYREED